MVIKNSEVKHVTEEIESFVDEEGSEHVAHKMKKQSTQIERVGYKTLKIYKPPTQETSDSIKFLENQMRKEQQI